CADATLTQMLLHFQHHINGGGYLEAFAGNAQRLIDRRQISFCKLHVNRGTRDLYDLANIFSRHNDLLCSRHPEVRKARPRFCQRASRTEGPCVFQNTFKRAIANAYCAAAAPLTISIISLVIFAWRARFMASVSESIMSEALLVAESMAVMRAACSAASDSSMARNICV